MLRTIIRPRVAAVQAKRTTAKQHVRLYAEEVKEEEGLKLTLATPYNHLYNEKVVERVVAPGRDGVFGILRKHVPTMEALVPGPVKVMEKDGTEKRFFIAGGFGIVHKDSSLTISTAESYAVEDFDRDKAAALLSQYQDTLSRAPTDEAKAVARVQVNTLQSLVNALG
mmetsp:Transcript_22503/g.25074  ORF Transcript_22503/g.25074 Transcript_22503/m.25074 type:complete len:168 (+) Transcript_22503:27-530(+)